MQLIEEVAEKDPRLGDLCVSYMLSLSPATKKEDVDVSQFSFSFTTLMRVLAAPRSEV